jgi:integrative and conjugative element protein (TIGR02256 family)
MRRPIVRISPIALRDIVAHAGESADGRETGGVLLGCDATGGAPLTVAAAGDAGPNAERSPMRFRRDLEHAQLLARQAWLLDRSLWVGDWHTHPMGSPSPSGLDLHSYRRVLATGAMPVFLSIIVSPRSGGDWSDPDVRTWVIRAGDVEAASLTTDRPRIVIGRPP